MASSTELNNTLACYLCLAPARNWSRVGFRNIFVSDDLTPFPDKTRPKTNTYNAHITHNCLKPLNLKLNLINYYLSKIFVKSTPNNKLNLSLAKNPNRNHRGWNNISFVTILYIATWCFIRFSSETKFCSSTYLWIIKNKLFFRVWGSDFFIFGLINEKQ